MPTTNNPLIKLEQKHNVQWRDFRIGDLFEHVAQGRRLRKQDHAAGTLPFVMAGVTNTGISGHISNDVRIFPSNSLTIDILGNVFYRNYEYGMGDDTGAYWNTKKILSQNIMLFISSSISKKICGQYSYGHKLRSSRSLNIKIPLPINKNGSPNYNFMEKFIQTLRKERIATLEAYLSSAGLADYRLTHEEKEALRQIQHIPFDQFTLESLFGKATRGKRLKSADRIMGKLPFVTAGESNNGISTWIGNKVDIFSKNTITIDMFGSAKYRNYEYGADDHVAVIHTEKINKFAVLFITSSIHKASHSGQFDYSRNFYAKDADSLTISLPVDQNGAPNYDFMENIISALQKDVIKNVIENLDLRIETTKYITRK